MGISIQDSKISMRKHKLPMQKVKLQNTSRDMSKPWLLFTLGTQQVEIQCFDLLAQGGREIVVPQLGSQRKAP